MKGALHFTNLLKYCAKKGRSLLGIALLAAIGTPAYSQYCTPSATNACTTNNGNETISNFLLGSINKASACSPANYEDFSATPNLETTLVSPSTGVPYALTALHADYASTYAVVIWIDLNDNGTFETTEKVAQRASSPDCTFTLQNFGMCNNVVKAGTLDIPAGVTPGIKRLRVRLIFGNNPIDPCAQITHGEAEDYRVMITGSTPVNTITVGTITPLSYCAGANIDIPFTASGTFNNGNTFTAELSDATGNFGTPVNIGSIQGTASGTIRGVIPANALYGTGYKIRVLGSDPATTGSGLSAAITINPAAVADVSVLANPAGSVCPGTSITFTASPVNGGTTPTYQWYRNGALVGSNQATYTSNALSNSDVIKVVMASNAICATNTPDTSNAITITLSSAVEAGTLTSVSNAICSGELATLKTSGSNTSLQWQSSTDGTTFTDISGITDTSYALSLSQTTYFRIYTASGGNCNDTTGVVEITVKPTPAEPLLNAAVTTICSSDSSQVCVTNNSTFSSYKWNNGATTACVFAKQAGGYWVTATAANGCSNSSSRVNIGVYPVSSVSIIVQGDTLASFGATQYQWLRNDTIIPGATSNTYIARTQGSYQVQITDVNGCISRSSAVNVDGTIGINDIQLNSDVRLFPNPASSSFNIQYSGNSNNAFRLTLYNLLGEKVRENSLNFNHGRTVPVDVSALAAGVYMVKLQSGASEITKRVVVQ